MTTNYENENLTFYKGGTGYHEFLLLTPDTDEAYNLTNFTITSQARLSYESAATIFNIQIVDGQNGNIFSAGKIYLLVDESITLQMPSQCVYDIKAISGNLTIPLAKGYINTLPSVTRQS